MDLEKAFQVDGQHAKVMTSNCVVSSELLDYKRKLEIKTTDLLWKDRESAGYQTELKKWRKECKAVGVELSASKEYSEQLLQKLSTAQALIAQQAASLKSVEAAIELTEKLKKSEASLTATTRKSRTLEAEVKSLRDKPPPPSQEELKRLNANLKKYKVSENTLKTELAYLHAQLETSQLKNKNFELEVEESRKAMEISNSMELLRTSLMTENHISMTEKEQIIADLKEEVEQLEFTTCACREENINLLGKLEKLSTDYTDLQSDNKSSVRKLENELDHIKEVVKDLEYTAKDREEIYCAMTDETVTLRSNLQVATANLANFTALAIDTKETINADKASIKVLKNSILRLRNQNQELKLQIYQIKDTPLMKERELINLHHLAASAMKERQEIQETVGHERKLRKTAEGTISSLNSEISYLQKQLVQTAELRMTWIEQKLVLKAEVSALYQSNKLLRKRATASDRCPITTQTHTVDRLDRNRINSSGSTGDISSISVKCPNSNGLLDDLYLNHRDHHLIDANENEGSVNANTVLQKKAERAVERAMFDIICAFSSASDLPATKKKKLLEDAGMYDVRQSNNGLYEVYFKSNNNNNSNNNDSSSIDAEELMNDLQISEFMKFQQNGSRAAKDSFLFSLFAEKLATILNYHRCNVHTVYQQLLAVRMENTALLSRATNFKARLNTAKRLLIQERAWKQMALLETIKKQTRISDYLLSIEYICKRAKNEENRSIEMMEKSLKQTGQVDENHTSLLVAASALELTAAYIGSTWASSPLGAGAMEIPLFQCGLDDETLHNVLEVLIESAPPSWCDVIQAPSSSSSSSLPSQDFSMKLDHQRLSEANYLSRIICLNLKGNCLTDLSCETLSALVGCSAYLRTLDLRDNVITLKGVKILLTALEHNPSVLHVSQKKGRSNVAGSIKDNDRAAEIIMIMIEGRREPFERSITEGVEVNSTTTSLPSLLIDLRHNDPQRASKMLEDLLECSAPVTQQTVGVEMGLSIDRSLVYRKLYGKLDTGARPCTSGGAAFKRITRQAGRERAQSVDAIVWDGEDVEIDVSHCIQPDMPLQESGSYDQSCENSPVFRSMHCTDDGTCTGPDRKSGKEMLGGVLNTSQTDARGDSSSHAVVMDHYAEGEDSLSYQKALSRSTDKSSSEHRSDGYAKTDNGLTSMKELTIHASQDTMYDTQEHRLESMSHSTVKKIHSPIQGRESRIKLTGHTDAEADTEKHHRGKLEWQDFMCTMPSSSAARTRPQFPASISISTPTSRSMLKSPGRIRSEKVLSKSLSATLANTKKQRQPFEIEHSKSVKTLNAKQSNGNKATSVDSSVVNPNQGNHVTQLRRRSQQAKESSSGFSSPGRNFNMESMFSDLNPSAIQLGFLF